MGVRALRSCLAVLLFLGLAPGAWAQNDETARGEEAARLSQIFARGCGDDDGNDRCDAEVQREMRRLYGLADAETLAAEGVTLRRAMFVDGYGNDVVAITFSRAPGRSPTVEIAIPRGDGDEEPQPLSAVVSQETWDRVLRASENFDQQLARERSRENDGSSDTIAICLHGWFVVAEAVDSAQLNPNIVGRQMEPSRIRRDAEGACAEGLAVPFAFVLADMALDNLTECSSLARNHARNKAALLARCQHLRGDRIAAAEAERVVWELDRLTVTGTSDEWRRLFDFDSQELAEDFRRAVEGGDLLLGMPNASDADHAEVTGLVAFYGEGEDDLQVADIGLTLVRQAGKFVIASYELSGRRAFASGAGD